MGALSGASPEEQDSCPLGGVEYSTVLGHSLNEPRDLGKERTCINFGAKGLLKF